MVPAFTWTGGCVLTATVPMLCTPNTPLDAKLVSGQVMHSLIGGSMGGLFPLTIFGLEAIPLLQKLNVEQQSQ